LNHVSLVATLSALGALRYTPAGVQVVELELEHVSTQVEAGSERQVQCTVKAIAMGEPAKWLHTATLGERYRVLGFLAAKGKTSRQLILHISEIHIQPD
jgi:primosomal replication protein N